MLKRSAVAADIGPPVADALERVDALVLQSYAELAAFLLDANDYPKGDKELPSDTPSQQKLSLKRGQ